MHQRAIIVPIGPLLLVVMLATALFCGAIGYLGQSVVADPDRADAEPWWRALCGDPERV